MNLLEFKRRLMTDPADRSDEMRAARSAGGEFAAAAEASDRFEARLHQALNVPVPGGLADSIILRQSLGEDSGKPRWPQLAAVAAALALAVAVTTFTMLPGQTSMHDLQRHLAWHWQHDGPQVLAVSADRTQPDPGQVQRVLSEFGVQLEPEMLEQVRMAKVCPTPDGAGAHIVLATESGPVTLYYMPRTRVPSSPARVRLGDGMEALALNVERGSLALIAEPGVDAPALAREISRQLAFAPGMRI